VIEYADGHHAASILVKDVCLTLCASLTDAEYAYAIDKAGEGVFERVYGIEYGR